MAWQNDNSKKCTWSVADTIFSSVFLGILIYIYIGFMYPDPHAIHGKWLVILWGIRATFPLFILGSFLLYFYTRTGRIKGSSLILILISPFFCILILYPLIAHIYYHSGQSDLVKKFHPYLQLMPHDTTKMSSGERDEAIVIYCLGGSTTEYTDSQGHGWPFYLQARLNNALPQQKIEVYNCGKQWYTSLHSLINYSTNIRPKRPDIIIVMHAINDLLHNADFCYFSTGPFRDDYGHFLGPITRWIKRPPLIIKIIDILKSMWYHKPRKIIDTTEFPGVVAFRRNLESLMDMADLDGTKVVLMTQPTLIKKDMSPQEIDSLHMLKYEAVGTDRRWALNTAGAGMEKYNDITRELARDRHVYLLDLEKVVPKTQQYFKDDVHYRDKAFGLIANHIAEHFLNSEFLLLSSTN